RQMAVLNSIGALGVALFGVSIEVRDGVGVERTGETAPSPRIGTVGPWLGDSVGTRGTRVFCFRDGLRLKRCVKGGAMRKRWAEGAKDRSWRGSPSRERLDEVEETDPAGWAARQRWVVRGGAGGRIDGREVRRRRAGGRGEECSPRLVEQG